MTFWFWSLSPSALNPSKDIEVVKQDYFFFYNQLGSNGVLVRKGLKKKMFKRDHLLKFKDITIDQSLERLPEG